MTPQKITVKIPRKQGELIPFNLELWNTGQYEAYDKQDGLVRILCTDKKGLYPIVATDDVTGDINTYLNDGVFIIGKEKRLFLRKKPSEELPKDDYLNFDYRGITGVWKSLTDLENHALPMRLGSIHITYQWEDAV